MSIEEKEGWTTLHVPKEVLDEIKQIREKENEATWKIIIKALRFYDANKKKEEPDETWIDEVSYFIMKLSLLLSRFLDNSNSNNFNLILSRLEEIKRILNVDVSNLENLVSEYKKNHDDKTKIKILDAYKDLIKRMIIISCQ